MLKIKKFSTKTNNFEGEFDPDGYRYEIDSDGYRDEFEVEAEFEEKLKNKIKLKHTE